MIFYKNYLNEDEFNFIKKNSILKKNFYSSYFGIFQSEIAVGFTSTLLRDKLGCNEKILSLDNTKNNLLSFPINGIFKLKNANFRKFEKRLDLLLNMKKKDYLKKIKDSANYIMEFDKKNSAIEKIKNSLFLD